MPIFSAAPVSSCDLPPSRFGFGNKCGHQPDQPNLQLPVPTPTGSGGHPRVLTLAAEKAEKFFFQSKWCSRIFGSSRRLIRSERREAIVLVCKTLLHYYCLSDQICTISGYSASNATDLPTIQVMASKAGISIRRFKRALSLLVNAGLVDSVQPRIHMDGDYYGLPAIRSLNSKFFELFRLDINFKKETRKAPARKQKKFGKNAVENFVNGVMNGSSASYPNELVTRDERSNRKRDLYNFYQRKFVDRKDLIPTQLPLPKETADEVRPEIIDQWFLEVDKLKQKNLADGGELQPTRWCLMATLGLHLPFGYSPPGFDMAEFKRQILKEHGSQG